MHNNSAFIKAPPHFILNGEVNIPASKSESNRALLLNALGERNSEIINLSEANDTILLRKILDGNDFQINVEDAGTTARFLTAYYSATESHKIISGSERMNERPMKDLIAALQTLGANIQSLSTPYQLPIEIKPQKLKGGEIEIDASMSSQFISALMMIAPTLENGLHIRFNSEVNSFPYLELTAGMLKKFGVEVLLSEKEVFISQQKIRNSIIQINGDWSAASFFICMAALSSESNFLMRGIQLNSLQGDEILVTWMRKVGLEIMQEADGVRIIKSNPVTLLANYDFHSYPDLALPVIVTAAAMNQEIVFEGVETLQWKESNRMKAIEKELVKKGVSIIQTLAHQYSLKGQLNDEEVCFDTYSDHRMAMSLTLLAMKCGSVQLNDPMVVKKSFPSFYMELQKLGFEISFSDLL